MRKMDIEDIRELLKTFMLDNKYGYLQVTASMSMNKENIVLSVSYDEESDTHLDL